MEKLNLKQMINDANDAYNTLRSDSVSWGAEIEERKVFGGALRDDLESDEVWSEDGTVSG